MTATAVTSVSMDPPSLLVCVNQRGRLSDMMQQAERFCVNLLHTEHVAVSRSFADPNLPERFASGLWHDDARGMPYLADAQVAIFCAKTLAVPYGSHTIFIGDVEDLKIRDDISPLLYQNATYGVCEPLRQEQDSLLAQLTGWG